MSWGARGTLRAACAAVAGMILWSPTGQAQAFLPEKGSFGYSVAYNDSFDKHHYDLHGTESDAGHIRIMETSFDVSYSPTDLIELSANLPFLRTEYHGAFPHPTSVDNGQYHSTFTDLRLEAHVQAITEPIAIAPYIAYVVPTHHYEALGHAAPGRRLHETWLGFFTAKSLDRWIPRTYVQLRYNYGFVEKVQQISHDTVNWDLEVGYYVTPDISVRAMGQLQQTQGGIGVPIAKSNPLFPYHDQLAEDDHLNIGTGAAWAYSDHASFFGAYNIGVRGRNGHKLGRGVSLGFGYGFGGSH